MTKKQFVLLFGIILLAVLFRFYQITSMPGGLFPDEAANGLDINLMQQGHLQPFYERGNGREALFFYMQWASVAMFGKGQWQMHAVASLVGVLSVVAVYLATRRLFLLDADENDVESFERKKRRATNLALLAAFFMAVSSWHVVLSRTAFRANLTPLFGAFTVYLLLVVYQAKSFRARLWSAFGLGAVFALGFYTYIAFRIMAPVLFMVVAWPLLGAVKKQQFGDCLKKYWKAFFFFAAGFLAFISWIAVYFYHHFDFFIGRSGQVSIFNQSLYTINGLQLTGKPPLLVVANVFWEVLRLTVTGFFAHGDLNWRQNISGFPFLSPLLSVFFGIGLALVLYFAVRYFFAPAKRPGLWKYFLLAGWFWGMLLPELATAEGIPHGLRTAGAIAPTFIICAWAVYGFAEFAATVHKKLWSQACSQQPPQWVQDSRFTPWGMRLINFGMKLVVFCFVLALILQTYFLYFIYAANSPEYFYAFRADLTPVSQYLVARCDDSVRAGQASTKTSTYLVLDKFSVQTTDYLTSNPSGNFSDPCNVPYVQVDPENSWQLSGLKSGDEIVFTQSSIFDIKKFKQYHPEAGLRLEVRNKFGQAVLAVYQVSKNLQ